MRGTPWPLTGRADELAALCHALASGGAVVVGPAGVGKSRLAAEAANLAALAADPGGPTRSTGSGSAGGPGPSPARVAGRVSARGIPLSPFAPVLPPAVGVLPPLDAPAAIVAALAERWPGPGSPVLVVDDAQWLDPVSATVVHQLALDHDVRLLVTVRQGEPLAPEIVQLYTDDLLARVELAGLDDEAVHQLVVTVLDGPVEASTMANLVRVCAGNVLYLRELVLGSLEAGLLVEEHGVWRFTGSLAASPRLIEIVDARLAGLGPEDRDVLEVVAVAGTVELPVLSGLADPLVVESLERAGLLTVTTAGSSPEVELGHPLHAEVLRAQIPALGRQRIARSLALATEAGTAWGEARPDQRLQRALWHLEGGLPIDPRRLFDAATESVDAGDQVLAARLATASFEADGSTDAAIVASWCRAELGERDEAERLLLTALDAEREPRDRAAITIRLAEDRYWGRADPDGARAVLDDLLAGPLGTAPAVADLVGAHRPMFQILSGRIDAGLAEVAPYVGHPDPLVAMLAEVPSNIGAALVGRCTDATARAGVALERAMTESFPYLVNPGHHVVALGWSMLHDGNLTGAAEIAQLVYAEAGRRPGFTDRGWAASVLGIVHLEVGRLADAARGFVEAEAMWRQAGIGAFARVSAGLRLLALAQTGTTTDPGSGRSVGAGVDLEQEPATMQFMEVYVARGRAWAAWAEGRRDQAVAGLDAAVDLGIRQGTRVLAAGAAHDLARIGRADLATAAFDRLGGFPGAGMPRLFGAHARALAANDLDALKVAASGFAASGYELYAAEAESQASRWAKRRGRARDAERLGAQAAARVAALGGVRTAMLEGVRRTGPLSRREEEVARLAAAGLSNREIAERLVLSERTVENHLYRVFTKLGITSRDEIADAPLS